MAHLSDLHFGKSVSPQKLVALTSDLVEQKPDLAIVTGDITDTGEVKQFVQAKDFLDSIGCLYVSVPGNRDAPLFAPWELIVPSLAMRRYRRYFGQTDRVFYQFEQDQTVLLGLNSVSQFPSWPGSISRQSRYWFRETCQRFLTHFKVLF
ncbi:MAG: metallophosphoesterase family protein, partial [Desulfomonilaceae bacterium]